MALLAIVALLAGLAGGRVVSWCILDVSPTYFAERLSAAVDIRHFWVGMAKVPVLAIVIALAGCRHGLSVRGDVEDLGGRVTVAVVQALFAIILLDAAFAILFNVLEIRSEEHTSELQSLMRISYAVFCLKKKKHNNQMTI